MTRAERLSWLKAHNVELLQFGDELPQLDAYMRLVLANNRPLRSFVEVGVWQGGSLFALADYLAPGAVIIGVDPLPKEAHYRKSMNVACELVKEGFDAHVLRRTSARAAKTVAKLLAPTGGKIDYLHIDGSHKYEDVRDDFKRYAPLVPSGGIIQLHDVVNVHPATGKPYGTKRFWEEISPKYPKHACFTSTTPGRVPGIGILRVE
jgi:predicted O-methyltransferase YrrM